MSAERTLRATPIHRALYRPHLVLGGERELVLLTAVFCGVVAFSALTIPAIVGGAVVWVIAVKGARMAANADPMMSRVYMRYLKYQRYYPARSRPWRTDTNSTKK